MIVYGTAAEAGTNRYAAEELQGRYRDDGWNIPILKDFEAAEEQLRHRDVIFIGRPEANSALAGWAGKLGLDYSGGVFRVEGKTYASERNSLVYAAKNPLDAAHMVLVLAGNSPLSTAQTLNGGYAQTPYAILEDGKPQR